ncbi:hypothetical protein E1180_16580 [Roseibium denhamense]|uniref:Uncharacterized membrane-anchored protein n=1 Tax=Roseibium denhamense TaxID=76305 RepID=A0ABY1P6R6_9HYPH|nr:GDYXXLXY domain-containing protein [Roseibium denhamense]MTI07127.1 hypothetical protein [Roseibium denhamense]SMP26942.1 Uncharacterized membrane-anchored protein [Roseibium denhamense]
MSEVSFQSGAPAKKKSALHIYAAWGLVAVLQLVLIAIPLADRLSVQLDGEEAVLDLVPIDPRDLLRGDYVIINLAIGEVPRILAVGKDIKAGDRVYVGLEPAENGSMAPVRISRAREDAGSLAIAGEVTSLANERFRIDYGIDAFFLPEGEGRIIEDLPRERVQLVVAITEDGRSLPLRLLVDGKPFKSDAAF